MSVDESETPRLPARLVALGGHGESCSENKKALDQVAVVRNRALRNQIAGAIVVRVGELEPKSTNVAPFEEATVEVQSQTADASTEEQVSTDA